MMRFINAYKWSAIAVIVVVMMPVELATLHIVIFFAALGDLCGLTKLFYHIAR